ncbi:uncharacterized protein LOC129919568 [Episyrphus balteatus]|uniref:uncharacterized protein LOC129919568 n=1 Tax=Episyrphus balteatus TaxID=286459 RepID=UPI0024858E91|nr:uncharacterized protein LOC129919568 [Episyrphus balteatus]
MKVIFAIVSILTIITQLEAILPFCPPQKECLYRKDACTPLYDFDDLFIRSILWGNVETAIECNRDDDGMECQIKECPAVDPPEQAVLLPNPADCTRFNECSNGILIEKMCPAGLHFNAKLGVCDYPQEAGCLPKN